MSLPPLTLRRAGPADAVAVDALTQAAYAKWVPIIGRKPMPMTADYAKAVVEHRIDLLEDGASLAALIEMSLAPDHLLIVNIAVDPAFQGQGLGTRLLAHAEDVARESGLGELRLYTNQLMAANVALYSRRGYEKYREEAFRGGVAIHMRKLIAG